MNARLKLVADAGDLPPDTAEVRRHIQQLLDSSTFARAPRTSRLLTFLLKKKLTGKAHEINEYAIGLEVFGRDARHYDTMIDPAVRVQIGRLRSRLSAYYAALTPTPAVVISIPLGSYVPLLTQTQHQPGVPQVRPGNLQLSPLRGLTAAAGDRCFVRGLDEELSSRLFRDMGQGVSLSGRGRHGRCADAGAPCGALRLEGSVRVEDEHVRASVRLVDAGAGGVVWLSQFDRQGQLCMALQEELAAAICGELRSYLAGDP